MRHTPGFPAVSAKPRARSEHTEGSEHPGVLVAKVGYFGVKSAKVCRVQMGTKPAKVGRLGAPGVLKCGAASTPHPDGRLRKKVFDPCREQSSVVLKSAPRADQSC